MSTFTSGYVQDDNRSLSTKNVGLKLDGAISVGTITDPTFNFTTSGSGVVRCYIQTSDGTVQQIGSDYTNSSSGDHTFTGTTSLSSVSNNFIVWLYHVSGSEVSVGVQYSGSTSGTGTEVFYSSSTTTPTYSSWSTATCTATCGVPLTFDYTSTGPVSSSGARLPPPPIVI